MFRAKKGQNNDRQFLTTASASLTVSALDEEQLIPRSQMDSKDMDYI